MSGLMPKGTSRLTRGVSAFSAQSAAAIDRAVLDAVAVGVDAPSSRGLGMPPSLPAGGARASTTRLYVGARSAGGRQIDACSRLVAHAPVASRTIRPPAELNTRTAVLHASLFPSPPVSSSATTRHPRFARVAPARRARYPFSASVQRRQMEGRE